ncbi:MAG: glycosyltransferase family 39 protein [Chloroflexi bacterium]|nr:glycosyltransferase family 39 protein [Chloroflexota bacterium]
MWEKSGLVILALWAVCVPVLTWILFPVAVRVQPFFNRVRTKHLLWFIVPALLIGFAITWGNYRVPKTFHTLTITPVVSESQKIELVEIKANGNILPPDKKSAKDAGWYMENGLLVAAANSRPLVVSFRTEINAPVALLFFASPGAGTVRLSLDKEQAEVNLNSPENRQTISRFSIHSYRGIPNWIFIPALVAADVLAVCSLLLFLLFLQEMGQTAPHELQTTRFPDHRRNIMILLIISGVLHLLNALAVPLLIDADSPTYLQGALHWLEFGNLDGVSMIRGPGTTFLFAPILLLFGRNPWGIKILLHLFAMACVPAGYRLAWQLAKNQRVALVCGLATALSPDLFFYSNFLMSDLPNLFFVLLFCTWLISALETLELGWVIAALAAASFATLLRSENISLLLIGPALLLAAYLWRWKMKGFANPFRGLAGIAFAFLIAAVPLLGWSAHNQRVYGYFGLSNYVAEVFYDGWVYFGDASRLAFSDPNSPAVQKIEAAIERYPIVVTDKSGVATANEIYPGLSKAGYTTRQIMKLFGQATQDSLKKDWQLSYKLLLIKIRAGLQPETTAMLSLPLPAEDHPTYKMGYFDDEQAGMPALILAQRKAYEYIQAGYDPYFQAWVYFCLVAMIFSLYRSPGLTWFTLILITSTRIFIPNIMGLSHWRYTLAGWIPLQIIGICWIATLIQGGWTFLSNHNENNVQPGS